MQIYDFTVAINGQRQLDAPGNYFYYYSGSAGGADQTITLRGVSSGLRIVLKNGQSLRLPKGQAPETSWYIGNYAGAATIVGTVIVGNGEIQDNRVQGAVEVIDGGKARTLTSAAFLGATVSPATAAQLSICQLWNPAGSGKNLIVENFSMSGAAAMPVDIGQNITALTNASTTNNPKLLSSAVAPIAQVRNQTNAVALATKYLLSLYMQANTFIKYDFKEPVVVAPGTGLLLQGSTVNTNLLGNFEWFEESTQ